MRINRKRIQRLLDKVIKDSYRNNDKAFGHVDEFSETDLGSICYIAEISFGVEQTDESTASRRITLILEGNESNDFIKGMLTQAIADAEGGE